MDKMKLVEIMVVLFLLNSSVWLTKMSWVSEQVTGQGGGLFSNFLSYIYLFMLMLLPHGPLLSFPVLSALSAIWVTEEMEHSLEVEWENPRTDVDYYKLKFRSLVGMDEKQVMVPKSNEPKSRHVMTGEYLWVFQTGQGQGEVAGAIDGQTIVLRGFFSHVWIASFPSPTLCLL